MSQLLIKIHPADNVAVVVTAGGLPAGTEVATGLSLSENIPQGHKVALCDIAKGDAVIRYNVVIGRAKETINAGAWVNENLLEMPAALGLENLPIATRAGEVGEPLSGFTFEGYRNADGSVGTRNILAISQTVQCVAGVVEFAVKRIREELLPKYPNVDGVVGLAHSYGCGVAIDAPNAPIPIRTLRNIALNPNFGGEVMIVSLGCEKMQPARLMPPETIPATLVDGPQVVCLQDEQHVGFMSMIESIMRQAETHLIRLNKRQRETCPASELVVGMQCGGSDAFSGITANPALGFAADLLVRAGATVMFSENTEVRDGIDQLTSRAATAEVAQGIINEMQWYDDYLAAGMVDRSANTTPGNKKGGLSNIVEKAMGSIVKSGSSPIVGVLSPGERLRDKKIPHGLVYNSTPASDFICGTLQLAAGMNLHIFTTGRGTPYGLAECPVIKVATRTDLARRWHDLMDVNAGRIADGEKTIEEMGWEVFQLMLDVASGKKTWAEQWKLHNSLVLFNPAPVT
ncbi:MULTISPECIES: galactarate dehydratase [unclassified Cellvibrio]|uniref:galactarate dehydratase n=1 Tax=unclassified Cellvibrio TaxID=2624793 RepID=UPI001246F52D|nr:MULTISPECIES: galactarate dehydratase [unclassified Cellvibrio]QEY10782.1 galactarate dehydratase [Cellvibrio sp. KY-YJ-3]UUA74822.1 galactarate dehydratase [Cellvibrio sp. QJXJ]